MDTITAAPITWRGLPATLVIGAELEAVLSLVGGHLACLRRRGEELNPLWQPPWPAADPATVRPAADGPYGDGPEAVLLASIVGSNLCCDRFGAPWPGEQRPLHGEAGCARWTGAAAADAYVIEAALPEAALTVRRRVRFAGDELELTTTVAHRSDQARAVEWCEHTNLGGDFLDDAEIAADVEWAVNLPGAPEPGYAHLRPEAEIPLAEALAMPAKGAAPTGLFSAAAVRQGASASWSATNRRLGRRLSATFSPSEFPWLGLWSQHHGRTAAPWRGRARVRGMELSTKPFPEGKPPAARARTYRGRPSECLVPPGAGLSKTIRLRWGRL